MTNFFENLDCVDWMESIQLLEDCWKQRTNCRDKTKMYSHIMELSSSKAEEHSDNAECLSPYLRRNEPERDKQYAFSVVLLKDNSEKEFPPVYPVFENKRKESGAQYTQLDQSELANKKAATHSEEILIKQLDDFLCQEGAVVKRIWIYSHNSPCLQRENKTVPCMFQLLHKACEWYKHYKVLTDVSFTKPWGLCGPNYFQHLNYRMISCPHSNFHSYVEKCKDIPFKLDHNNLRDIFKKKDISNTLSHVRNSDKNTLRCGIKSARQTLVRAAQSSFGLRDDHLRCGKEVIDSFDFLPGAKDKVYERLQMEWTEMVNNSSLTPIREAITDKFNNGTVNLFQEELKSFVGNSCPLRLHRHNVGFCFCP
ncbi:uncharacterized protein LOC121611498 [Chelmon rostratus]|uniref:uncharacterized protein LOC121611498 n=1 Tax=Chelmon rostratus TaxID=109905 RepID=UPI001BE68B1F|nr:uncharacterized protein LOC121611498 [Chelmon rostratus]